MKRIATVFALAAAVSLAGCGTTGLITPSGGGGGTPVSSGNATVDQVVAATVKACGFLPTVQTAANVLSTFVPGASVGVGIANAVANAICNAVTPAKSAMGRRSLHRGDALIQVNGVPIEGRFVR